MHRGFMHHAPMPALVTSWRPHARLARLAAFGALGVLVLAGSGLPTASLAQEAPRMGEPPAAPIHVPWAVRRELNHAQSLLRLGVARLPRDEGVELLRESEAVILRVPAQLLFRPDSRSLQTSAATARLLALPERVLRRRHRLTARIEVYTDNIGGAGLNLTLSQQRAQTLLDLLQRAGISARRLEAHGQGLSAAIASNDTPEGRMRNRRVEFVFERVGTRPPDLPAHSSATTSASTPLRPAQATARAGA